MAQPMPDAKTMARKAAFARRKTAHATGLDGPARTHLSKALARFAGRTLGGYMPIRTEIDPRPVMSAWDGPVCVPVVLGKGKPLAFHRWSPETEMIPGAFGAAVPVDAIPLAPEILIVPLLAFTLRGDRLGYGGGFYDRTLERARADRPVTAIGFAYSAQQADMFPRDSTDQPLDAVVTENGIRWFG
ncbi:MAG: 5-formyltetrahydrofolate cyclo-ligase [Pseudomonadota bacterium]